MKKINSIHFGLQSIESIAIFVVIIPSIIYGYSYFTHAPLCKWGLGISLLIGIGMAVVFTIMLLIEFRQDRLLNNYYAKRRAIKVLLKNGVYECQNCGNRKVTVQDTNCHICGIYFKEGLEVDKEAEGLIKGDKG